MTRLSVNINKFATLRNARGGNVPNLVKAARDAEKFGAQGITVHPRPDERHITRQDVYDLAEVVTTEFNIEGYPDERYMKIVRDVKPTQATLVPDPPDVLTSNAGWNTLEYAGFLKEVIAELKSLGIRTSIFMETDLDLIEGAAQTGADRIELYTEAYAEGYYKNAQSAVGPYVLAAKKANELGLGINAGHDLNLDNLEYFLESVPGVQEVSIGHALISDAIYLGLENTIQLYLQKTR